MSNHDLTQLLDIAMPYAIESLCQKGRFQPFGLSLAHDGDVNPHVARTGGMRQPYRREIEDLYQDLKELARSQTIMAVIVCREYLFRAPDQSVAGSAILCSFEHENGAALDLVLPYEIDFASHEVSFGNLIRKLRNRSFFTQPRRVPMSVLMDKAQSVVSSTGLLALATAKRGDYFPLSKTPHRVLCR